MRKPRLLDLCCCAGLASDGYARAGWDVAGVDIVEQPNYPYHFRCADALEWLPTMLDTAERFDKPYAAIHASPPCQHGTAYKRRPDHVKDSPNLVPAFRAALDATGLPYVIEQPKVNAWALIPERTITLDGTMFDLDVMRPRCFESNVPWPALLPMRNRARQTPRFAQATNRTNLRRTVEIGVWRIPLDVQKAAMGIERDVTLHELSESIPPAYTEWIGAQLLGCLTPTPAPA
jgi:hypothetical protein